MTLMWRESAPNKPDGWVAVSVPIERALLDQLLALEAALMIDAEAFIVNGIKARIETLKRLVPEDEITDPPGSEVIG